MLLKAAQGRNPSASPDGAEEDTPLSGRGVCCQQEGGGGHVGGLPSPPEHFQSQGL